MLKRAVITGMGVTSPNGYWKNGILPRHFRWKERRKNLSPALIPQTCPVKIAGEIQDFNELDWIEAKRAQARLALRAAGRVLRPLAGALKDAGLEPEKNVATGEARDLGVVLGTGGGAGDFSDAQYQMYYIRQAGSRISIFSIPSGTSGTMSNPASMRLVSWE